jgi:hypothetical protein
VALGGSRALKAYWTRKLAALLMLACAAEQGAIASTSVTSALAHHADDQAHSVAVVAKEGQLHVVLSHAPAAGPDEILVSHQGHIFTSFPSGDHVIDFANRDGATTRSTPVDSPRPLVFVATPRPDPSPLVATLPPMEPRVRSADPLRTVVLRL